MKHSARYRLMLHVLECQEEREDTAGEREHKDDEIRPAMGHCDYGIIIPEGWRRLSGPLTGGRRLLRRLCGLLRRIVLFFALELVDTAALARLEALVPLFREDRDVARRIEVLQPLRIFHVHGSVEQN